MSVRRIVWFVVALSGVVWGVTPHAQIGPPPAPLAPPVFLSDLALPDPDACLCLPPYMLQAPNAEHHWWAKATGEGPLDVHVIGLGINPAEAGTLQVRVFDPAGVQVYSGSQPQPVSGEYPWAPVTVFPSPGDVYRISLRVQGTPNTPVARHYRLKLRGASLLGANSPLPSQAEHDDADWAINASAGETFSVVVNSGPEAGATSGVIALRDPSGVIVQMGTLNTPMTVAAAAAGMWTVHVRVHGHYVIRKMGGPDTGVYVNWKTWGQAGVSGTISPASLPVTVELLDSFGNVYDSLANVTGRYEFTRVSPDVYTVRILAPGVDVPSQTVVVSCERPAVADFVIPSGAGGKVTAGVLRSRDGGRGGFNVQSDGDTTKGELQFQTATVNFHAHTMSWLVVSADRTRAWFGGIGNDGLSFTAYVEDNGEPGRSDIFQLWVEGVLLTGSGALTGGNVQIHR
jgi:hypothetical protein